MNSEWNAALAHSLSHVMERLCFMIPTPASLVPLSTNPAIASMTTVCIHFDGPFSGRLELALSPELVDVVTGNMLGEDGPHPQETRDQAICELANIACGNLLPLIAGRDAIFDLGTPEAHVRLPVGSLPDASVRVRFEEGTVGARLALHFDRGVS